MTGHDAKRRIVITGMGVVSPIGIGLNAYWQALLEGRIGIGPIEAFDASDYPCRIAAEVHGFKATDFFDRKKARLLSRGTKFGVASALMCLEDAKWSEETDSVALGVSAGISNSPQDTVEEAVMQLRDRGYRRTLPYQLNKSLPHSLASETGSLTGFQHNVMTFSTACTAGINAIGYAVDEIRAGRVRAMLCPSSDANITQYGFGYFCRAGMLTTNNNNNPQTASRPFDRERDGGVLGEGAACLLLEDYEFARLRRAYIYGEITGFGTSGTGYDATDPERAVPAGMAKAILGALRSANCHARQIDYIGAHGVSDPHLDRWETQAIKDALGNEAYKTPISSVKGNIGIPQNAAGSLQLVAAIMALNPDCDLDYVPNQPRYNKIRRALAISHGFNGSDAAILIEKDLLA